MEDDKRTKTEPAETPVELPQVESAPEKKTSLFSSFVTGVKKTMDEIGNAAERKTKEMQAELDQIPGSREEVPTYGSIEEKIQGRATAAGAQIGTMSSEEIQAAREERKKRALEKLKGESSLDGLLANEDD